MARKLVVASPNKHLFYFILLDRDNVIWIRWNRATMKNSENTTIQLNDIRRYIQRKQSDTVLLRGNSSYITSLNSFDYFIMQSQGFYFFSSVAQCEWMKIATHRKIFNNKFNVSGWINVIKIWICKWLKQLSINSKIGIILIFVESILTYIVYNIPYYCK